MAANISSTTTNRQNRVKTWCARNIYYIIGFIVVIAVLIVAYIVIASFLNEEENVPDTKEDVPFNYSQALVYNEKGTCKLWVFDPDVNDAEHILVYNQSENLCYFDFYMNETIFYSDDFSSIKSTSNEYKEIKLPINKISRSNPKRRSYGYALAVDYIEKNIYALSVDNQSESDKLIVIDFKHRNDELYSPKYNIILSNLNSPKHIALDPASRLMFIVQSSWIFQVELDGTQLEILVQENSNILAFAVDVDHKQVWWTTDTSRPSIAVKTYNPLTSSENKVTFVIPIRNPYTAVAYVSNKIFTMNSFGEMSCRFVDSKPEKNCSNSYSEMHYPEFLRGYNFDQMTPKLQKSTCAVDNGGCEYLCIARVKGIACACQMGYVLMEDGKHCKKAPEEYMIYAKGNYIGARILNATWQMPFAEVVYPVRIVDPFFSRNLVVGFDVLGRDHIYASDGYRFYSRILDHKSNGIDVDLFDIQSVAVDWGSKQIYTLSTHEIRVLPHDFNNETMSKVVYKIYITSRFGSLAIHPNRGYFFFIKHDLVFHRSQIFKMNSDGSNVKTLFANNTYYVRELSALDVDVKSDKLYWFNENGTYIEYIDIKVIEDYLETDKIKRISVDGIKDPTHLHVHEDLIYVNTRTSIYLIREGKSPELVYMQLPGYNGYVQELSGPVIYKNTSQQIDNRQVCEFANVGCQRFCFYLPQPSNRSDYKCGCYEDEILQADGKTCRSKGL